MHNREKGVVKWFILDKGYGIIESDVSGQEMFVHYSNIHENGLIKLHEGQRVEYTPTISKRGPTADNVIPLDEFEIEIDAEGDLDI